ncbi:MAG: DPP IV N-terminal domain-containing protein, partial [Gammaproteobacteria bacterium]
AADELVLTALKLEGQTLSFAFDEGNYRLDLQSFNLDKLAEQPQDEYLSPDGSRAVFIQDHNLWLRDTATNSLTQLTFDGVEDYGYGTNNAGWIRGDGPVVKWSPDSSKIASFRHDGRNVGEMYLWNTQVGHPELDQWKYPLPGDDYIFMIERLIIHLDPEPRLVRLDMPPDNHRSTTSDHVAERDGTFLDAQWSADSERFAFVSSSRDHKIAQLRLADINTGAITDVHREQQQTHYMAGQAGENWRVLHDRNQFIWYSEQDNWGHLYLYDLQSGELVRQLSSGSWLVLDIERVDLDNDWVYLRGSNREPGNAYYEYQYRVSLEGGEPELLTPEIAHHQVDWSESGNYFTDIYSARTEPHTAVIRDRDGKPVMNLEQTDITALIDAGWVAPVPFITRARDQLTELFGLMYRPSNFDSSRSYPVLNYLYPGPMGRSIGSFGFQAASADKQAVAELGFIVVEVNAMGTPGRSKSFHDIYYGNMGDNGLPDQVATIRQLAAENPWMDIDRVGIWGHSGGGFASTAGILRYPDFYKVAVSSAGNHDNRNYEDDWGEHWQGLLETYPESNPDQDGDDVPVSNYDNQANQLLAENLQGKLLLAHGLMDTNVHPSSTLLLVDALIKADKDFDLVILPNRGHGFVTQRYFMNRRWDYFVEHLIGAQPPADFVFADNIP